MPKGKRNQGPATNTPAQTIPPKQPPKSLQESFINAIAAKVVDGPKVLVSTHARKRSFPGAVTPGARERNLETMRQYAIKPGEVRNPDGAGGKKKPFRDAALAIAEINIDDLHIDGNDTVAVAMYKTLAMRGFVEGEVSCIKELADRAEGPAKAGGDQEESPQVNVFVQNVISTLMGDLVEANQ